ncbi:hypothetical protein ISM_12870 [Roseovarius nubinhibens ISM]|uniref:Uncharacterized protein n=1 Tax=Roseovarius nubinhibens (strain ATCC BAA-591 / DSM 15170 / ISM) TaxID=89187 RepID=A3SMR8_ROSNI|nr:hypothetical protein ISM_12870 [Roseovarius nubinhibens ISM]
MQDIRILALNLTTTFKMRIGS